MDRICSACGASKPIDREHFRPDERYRDGFTTKCNECLNAYKRNRRHLDAEYDRLYQRNWRRRKQEAISAKLAEQRPQLPECDWAYLAGLVDGEGTIAAHARPTRKGNVSTNWRVMMANTNKDMIDWLVQRFGGSVYSGQRRSSRHRQMYTWYCYSKMAVDVIVGMLPYLRIKRRQAELVLELVQLPYGYQAGSIGRVVDPEIQRKRALIVAEMAELNRRGTVA